ncbi:MAG: diguanylate cyclase [Thermodesulfobacteriota bacterium]
MKAAHLHQEKGSEYPATLHALLEEKAFAAPGGPEAVADMERRYGSQVYADALFHLTRLEMDGARAKANWDAILAHRESMAASLDRGVGLRTAVCDYFIGQGRVLESPVVIESRLLVQREDSAFRDELTGVFNRRFFNMEMRKEVARTRRSAMPFCVFMIDGDHFKAFNDRYGHQAGDAALQQLARIFVDSGRINDQVCRYGGEEFVIILPRTSKQNALMVAERFRRNVENHLITYDDKPIGSLTVSIGVACCPDDATGEEELVRLADWALYRAKTGGRNQVSSDTSDRRMHRRMAVDTRVEFEAPDDGGLPYQCRAADISLGGLMCESNRPFERGAPVMVRVHDPAGGEPITLTAKAVRSMESAATDLPYRTGFTFDAEEPARLLALHRLLERLADSVQTAAS